MNQATTTQGEGAVVYELRDLTLGYGRDTTRVDLLSRVGAQLRAGELTCLIGSNGAGKSTLLRTMAAQQTLAPDCGTITLMGRPLADYTPTQMARTVSVVLTDEVPERNLRAVELVAMGRLPYTGRWGTLSADDRRKVDEALDMVGMRHLSQRRLCELSDGERQKTMIAKALAQDTDVILLDEPLAFLDWRSKAETLRLLAQVAEDLNKGVLLSTHDIELALQMTQQLWVINNHTLTVGEPHTLAQQHHLDFLFNAPGITFDPQRLQYTVSVPHTPVR